ncbi:unnamed protein product [Calicophoron daubneyi]|uniref:Regulator of microtubule dynamics protein 1 n=1 Tax=Calicophoron daubneyi TaxID=300641 RepID=A0AAV2TMD5_CALDB
MDAIISQADALFKEGKYQECQDLLVDYLDKEKHPEIYWRLARCCYMKVESQQEKPQKSELKDAYTEVHDYAKAGFDIDPENAKCLTWYGIGIDELANLEGQQEWIKRCPTQHYYWTKAATIDPNDYVTETALGIWCFTLADMTKFRRRLSSTLGPRPPSSSYEEALNHLLKSEELEPKGSVKNLLYIAKCYKGMGEKDKCIQFCKYVFDYRGLEYGAEEAKSEVRHLLYSL